MISEIINMIKWLITNPQYKTGQVVIYKKNGNLYQILDISDTEVKLDIGWVHKKDIQ